MKVTQITNKRAEQLYRAIENNCEATSRWRRLNSTYNNLHFVGKRKHYSVQTDGNVVKHISVYSNWGVHVKQYYNFQQWEVQNESDKS